MLGAALLGSLLALAPLRAGDPAPDVDLVDLGGRPVSLAPNGQVVIVDFFATWCPSCRRSLVDYRSVAEALGDRVRIVVVDVREPAELTRAFFARYPLPRGVVLARDPYGRTMRSFGASSFPTCYVIDESGVVRSRGRGWGADSAAHLVAMARRALEGPRPARKAASATGISADERARRMGVEIVH
jgi:thiol-disulfide isomerase/thioredoxin